MWTKLLAGAAIAALSLVGACGDQGHHDTPDGPDPNAPTSMIGGAVVPHTLVGVVGVTGPSRELTRTLTPLRTVAQRQDFLRALPPAAAGRVRALLATARPTSGQTLMGGVAAIGCDVPGTVVVHRQADALVVAAARAPVRHKECYIPYTSVAILTVASAALER